ncbi:hypothetical protein [Anaerosolibacter carboniphilus]|uniref:hypothetical protein n=1 Tax=Anaerosolibacter carboniphilus TaxID=1417629 RepID=UPI001A9BDB95|nr:hypothetical protein [Anaerosolibacter carboniphilus]
MFYVGNDGADPYEILNTLVGAIHESPLDPRYHLNCHPEHREGSAFRSLDASLRLA